MKKIYYFLSIILLSFTFVQCDDDDRGKLDLDADVMIADFFIGDNVGEIDNKEMKIKVVLPPFTDVTQLKPSITLSDPNATISPESGVGMNFTNAVEYTVSNGNLFNKYTVSVEVIKGRILRFILKTDDNSYQGVINQTDNTIIVVVPEGTDVTSLTPEIECNEDATVNPASGVAQDFSQPKTYTVNYYGEEFTYEVTVVQSNESYAFVGVASSVNELSTHEKTAAEWMLNNIPNSYYIPFSDIKDGNVDLNNYDVIWFHYGSARSLPTEAVDRNVVRTMKAYYEAGGNVLLSTFACLYTANLGAANGNIPNNVFGDDAAWTVDERWGISFDGNENHPIFQNLERADDRAYPAAYFVGKNVHRKNSGCLWHIENPPYNGDKNTWITQTGGIPLAALDWDQTRTRHVAISEFPKADGKGALICIGAPSYEWYNEDINGVASPENPYRSNMEIITYNSIMYLKE